MAAVNHHHKLQANQCNFTEGWDRETDLFNSRNGSVTYNIENEEKEDLKLYHPAKQGAWGGLLWKGLPCQQGADEGSCRNQGPDEGSQ